METHWSRTPYRIVYHHRTSFCCSVSACLSTFVYCLTLQAVALIVLLFCTGNAFAQSSTLSLSPSFQELEIEQGSGEVYTTVEVRNSTDTDQLLQAQAIDISQFDAEGNVTLSEKPAEGNAISFASYVTVEPASITLLSGQSAKLSITIKDSPDLSPGGHYAAILLKGEAQSAKNTQTVIPALTSFLLVQKKGGERYGISLAQVSEFSQSILTRFPEKATLRFHNSGNSHLVPFGTVTIRTIFGQLVAEGVINEGSKIILPNTDRNIHISLRDRSIRLPLMLYSVSINGYTRPGNVPFHQESSFLFINPVSLLLLFLLSAGVAFFIRRKFRV